jgi:hypothetical protein
LDLALTLSGVGAIAQGAPPATTLIEPSYTTALIRDVLAAANH